MWARAVEAIDAFGLEAVEVLARDDDFELLGLLAGAGFAADDRSGITWMDSQDRPDVAALRSPPEGRLRHQRGTRALRRRRLPGDLYERVIQLEETGCDGLTTRSPYFQHEHETC